MKISILIIAHNEETHIQECIESVLNQSKQPSEIILIAHNCTDKTVDIVREYPEVTLYILETSEKWPQYSRKYWFEKVTWDIIVCIDGDGVAKHDWLMQMIAPFKDKNVIAVWWRVWFYRNIMANLSSLIFFMTSFPIIRTVFPFFFWWANFACRKSAYESIWWFERILSLQEKLLLNYPAEDALLSFALMEVWKITFASRAIVTVHIGSYFDNTNRLQKQREDNKKIRKYFGR